MSETEGQQASGDEPRAQETQAAPEAQPQANAPRNDAEAAAQAAAEVQPPKDGEQKPDDRKKNRTGQYIHKLQTQIAEYREREKAWSTAQQAPQSKDAPTLEQFNYDAAAYQKAVTDWAANNVASQARQQIQKELRQQHEQEIIGAYNQRLNGFMETHPDFQQAVAPLQTILPEPVQFAILAHPNGPEIAYHVANDDDLAFQLASIQPHLAAAAVERIASRMTAAPQVPQQPTTPIRPVSQAPAPVPTVSGKTPSQTPPEKLTDDEWFARKRKR